MNVVTLSDVADVNPRSDAISGDTEVSFVGMADLDATTARTVAGRTCRFKEVSKGYTVFRDRDILVAKITPCFENCKIGQAQLSQKVGVGSTEFHVVRPHDGVLDRYLLHYLRQDWVRVQGESRMTGSGGQRRVPVDYLKSLRLTLPPLDEQRRIAAILDQADFVRLKRREAIARLSSLEESLFLDLFDEQNLNQVPFSTVVTGMRNGLSPAKAGQVIADVLTLSAVTRGRFDPKAAKASTFLVSPPPEMRVSVDDFLICRGNGNLKLCGVGVHPKQNYPDLTFPDTVIAATLDAGKVDAVFLEAAWRRPAVRRQIEAVSRTTNGTYKINQQNLGAIMIPLPSRTAQQEFAKRVRTIPRPGLGELNDLFASLQSRAFSGQL